MTPGPIQLRGYIVDCCEALGVALADVLGSSRRRDIVCRRFLIAYMLHERFGCSYSAVADLLHYKDHTSVIHAVRVVRQSRVVRDSWAAHGVAALRLIPDPTPDLSRDDLASFGAER